MKKMLNWFVAILFAFNSLGAAPVLAQAQVETPTPTVNPTELPMETATPTEAPTATQTPIPTETPIITENPAIDTSNQNLLNLTSDLPYYTPGSPLQLNWNLAGFKTLEDLQLSFFFPTEILLSEKTIAEGSLDEKTGAWKMTPTAESGALEATSLLESQGTLSIQVQLLQKGTLLAEASLQLEQLAEINQQGGEISLLDGRIKLSIPDGALTEATGFLARRPDKASLPEHSLSGNPFEILAFGTASKAAVERFTKPITIQLAYSEGALNGDESNLRLYYYDPSTKAWLPMSSYPLTEENILVAESDHLTVFDYDAQGWQAARLPTVENFQTSLFTGAASYTYPLQLPGGSGGFAPSLSLSYNSQVIDNSTARAQASWAGMGWSLETGSIERNMNGTNGLLDDDTFIFNGGGSSGSMLIGQDGNYHLMNENYWKIQYDSTNDRWNAWDKSGTKYVFGYSTYDRAKLDTNKIPDACSLITYRWNLSSVTRADGVSISYSNSKKTVGITNLCGHSVSIDRAIYPTEIKWANNRYHVKFNRSADRTDYDTDWATLNVLYMEARLTDISVEQDSDGNGTFETLIRKYTLNYETNNQEKIYPNYAWPAGGRSLTLENIQEWGQGGTTSLPATSFTYGDGMHLTRADNGQGGVVEFDYDRWVMTDLTYTSWSRKVEQDFGAYAEPCVTNEASRGGWAAIDSGYNAYVFCYSQQLKVFTNAKNSTISKPIFKPGGEYKLYVETTSKNWAGNPNPPPALPPGTSIQLGIGSGSTYVNGAVHNYPYNYASLTLDENLSLPASASNLNLYIYTDGSGIDFFRVTALPTIYRVIEKRIYDGIHTSPNTFNYTYTGATMNLDSGSQPYVKSNSEFRGHSSVTETGPDGRVTQTWFHQDDVKKGMLEKRETRDSSGNLYLVNENSYDESEIAHGTLPKNKWGQDYSGLAIMDVHTDYSISKSYEGGTSFVGTRTDYSYDSYGNVIGTDSSEWDGTTATLYRSQTMDYYPNTSAWIVGLPGRVQSWDASSNRLTEKLFFYDSNTAYTSAPTVGRLAFQRSWVSGTQYSQVSYTYDTWSNPITVTGYSAYGTASSAPSSNTSRTVTSTYDYIYHFYLESEIIVISTDPQVSLKKSIGYNTTLGVPTSLKYNDDNSTIISAEYDSFGRLLKIIKPGDSSNSPTLSISYYNYSSSPLSPFRVDLVQKIDSSTSFTLRRFYDGLGRQLQTQTANAEVNGNTKDILVDYSYDAFGRVLEQTVPFDVSPGNAYVTQTFSQAHSHTTYDLLGRPLSVTAPDSTSVSYAYDLLETAVTDANSQTTTSGTDIWGRTVQVAPPTGPGLTYEYDESNQLTSVGQGSLTTTLTYDQTGRKLSMDDPDMGYWTYSYDALGNLTSQVDERTCTISLTYDLLSRLTGKSSSGAGCGSQVSSSYSYDNGTYGKGRRTGSSSNGVTNAWVYDSRGRMDSQTVTIGGSNYTTSMTYNSVDLPTSMTYPDNETVNFTYTPQMALNSVIGTSTYLSSSQYDEAGRLTARALGNGLTQYYTYNPWTNDGGRLANLTTGTLQDMDYSYDDAGNILSIFDDVIDQTQSFAYDALQRLTSAAATGGQNGLYNESYTYNSTTGNLASKAGVNYTYATNHPHAVSTLSNGNEYIYDGNGNMISREINNEAYTLSYDAENRLIGVSGTNLSVAFTYDADGKRVQQVLNSVTTKFIGSHYEVEGTTLRKYYLAGSTRIAMRTGTDAPVFFLQDHLGSTSITTNSSGDWEAEIMYKAWGEVRYESTNPPNPTKYTYTGQYSNTSDFGLMYYGARWYDPSLSRFAQVDSIIPGAGNPQAYDRYAYVFNNPINATDPSGHNPDEAGDGLQGYSVRVHVALSSSLTTMYTNKAQYTYNNFVSYGLLEGNYNLCGELSIEMIYQTLTGKKNMLGPIWNIAHTLADVAEGEGMYAWQVVKTLENFLPNCTIKQEYTLTAPVIKRKIPQWLQSGYYLIAGVFIDTSNGKLTKSRDKDTTTLHWVVVTGYSYYDSSIAINNPFCNGPETYSWDEFEDAFFVMITVTPPPPPLIPPESQYQGGRAFIAL